MKRILLTIAVMFFIFSGTLFSQNAITGSGFTSGWDPFGAGDIEYFASSEGTSFISQLQANGTGDQYFRICVDWGGTKTQHTINPPADSEVYKDQEITLNSGSTTNGAMYFNVSDVAHNYIFKTKDAGTNPTFQLIVFQVEGDVRTVSGVVSDKTTVYPGQDVTITATLDGSLATGQGVYLRYTNDNYATSTVVEMSGSGTSYSAVIPASMNTASSTISYYVFTSGNGLTISSEKADWYTINLNNNGNLNYGYTTEEAYTTKSGATTWSNINSWDAGFLPLEGQPVTIEDYLTLDQDVTVSDFTINAGAIFTANDGSKTTKILTLADGSTFTNNGTFNASEGIVEFTGSGTVSGTVIFYDVDISGTIDFGGGATVSNNLKVLAGGHIFGQPPIYTMTSTLIFETGGDFTIYDLTTIWKQGSVLGAGVPYNVSVTTTNPLRIYDPRNVIGNLSISDGASVIQGDNSFEVGGQLQNWGDLVIINNGTEPFVTNGFVNYMTGSVTLSEVAGGDLKVSGEFTNNGTFTHNDRAVFFNGSSQRISGTSETSLGYVYIENDADVTLAFDKELNIDKDFAIGDGSKAAGSFKIESTSSSTGSLITGGAVPASIEIERYIEGWTSADDGWHLLSIPFESFTVTSSDFAPDATDDLYYYDEPSDMWINWKTGGSPNSDPGFDFVKGKGYLCSYQTTETKSFSGALNNADVFVDDLCVDGSGARTKAGWNMIGNPYASSLLWSNSWGTEINAVAKIYPGTGNYIDVDPVNGIPSAQAFFVQVTAETDLTIPTTARLHSDEPWRKSIHSELETLSFEITGGTNSLSDKTRIRFAEEATEDFDTQYDAFKLFGLATAPQLYTMVADEPYSTNTYAEIKLERVIDLEFVPGTSGQHQIELIENTCNEDCVVLLDDLFNQITVVITKNTVYKFDANTGDDPNRFKIRFSAVGIDEEVEKESLQAYISGDRLYIVGEEGRADLSIYNLQGQLIMTEAVELNKQFNRSLSLDSGIYLLSLRSQNETKSTKISIR